MTDESNATNFGALEKHFDASTVEEKWCQRWEEGNLFDSSPQDGRDNYCIMLPPPNVTGTLHMGHAFQHTLMDALTRRERMRGRNVLWQAGTDHAGIATQIVVTRELATKGIDAATLTREEFLCNAWAWKEQSGNTISEQMRRLGASCDWTRSRFTMDDKLSATVTEVFVRLYEAGLIYRGKRLVNWDPVLLTAVSDLEVTNSEEEGVMYYVRYPFVGDEKNGIVIGTTRPETILVDGAIAVHPDDKRYAPLLGQQVHVPLTDPPRQIEIIADTYVEPEFGSGCVKITAAHDFNDYEVYKRHADKNIPVVVLFTPDAKMNDNAPADYRGMDRFAAREKIVEDLKKAGLLIKSEAHQYKLPRGDRSGVVLEPMLTDQWFMRMDEMAGKALKLADDGKVRFVPANWRKTYDQWLNNIQDWCLSRQLLWGHRIPAWYDEDGNIIVACNEADAVVKAGGKTLRRDDDVLDTWFSSALWPFSTLGWPDTDNPHFQHYFPTSVLVTGFDILFFWVARMVMMSEHFTGQTPFRDVYITGLVRDAEGQKMSKSKGNVLDPMDLIDGIDLAALVQKRTSGLMNPAKADAIKATTEKYFANGIPAYGVDALRFTFASLASYGRDIKFDLERCAGYRNFCNKLWNAARFVLGVCDKESEKGKMAPPSIADRWLISRLQHTEEAVSEAFGIYRFDLAAQAAYQFVWNEYCDWYVEIAKIQLRSDAAVARRTRHTLVRVLESALRLLHPLMPFVTDELWEKIAPLAGVPAAASVMLTAWPEAEDTYKDTEAEVVINRLIALVDGCRRLRGEVGIPPAARPVLLVCGDSTALVPLRECIEKLARFESINMTEVLPDYLPRTDIEGFSIAIEWEADNSVSRELLTQKLEKLEKELQAVQVSLTNAQFIQRAPAAVVDKKRSRCVALQKERDDIFRQLVG
ncbi:valine--tRNA ligase [Candidatus Persebacteraceae bacterium Df01]|uniref:Valine--tRNA ligase n=1 Tax=Candidatus Doriopsillibacter californiensis TaxID=2970740 RepID=A0ABT7QL72_9GAMM|nr:valine--tRNA ligase [Candidatus Persebacteraceae bacterium Df01]